MGEVESSVGDIVDAVLRPAGFRRRGLTWNRDRAKLVDIVEGQVRPSTRPNQIDFTLNLGVLSPGIFVQQWERPIPLFYEEPFSQLRCRIGDLMDGQDTWWECAEESLRHGDARLIINALIDFAIPYFDSLNSEQDVYAHLQSVAGYCDDVLMYKLARALLARSAGDTEICTELINELKHVGGREWEEKMVRLIEP